MRKSKLWLIIDIFQLFPGTVHNPSRAFECDFCNFQGNSKSNLKQHKESVHENKKNWFCDECSYSSYYKDAVFYGRFRSVTVFGCKIINLIDNTPGYTLTPHLRWKIAALTFTLMGSASVLFCTSTKILSKISSYCIKFYFSVKIWTMRQKTFFKLLFWFGYFYFWMKLQYWPKYRCWHIFVPKHYDFRPTFRFSIRISIFDQNFDFWPKFRFSIKIFANFWRNIFQIFCKNCIGIRKSIK